jgi:glycosyltransferase involved in cell wall biosynthesis
LRHTESTVKRVVVVDTLLRRPPLGGCQTFLLSLTRWLIARGLEVAVVADAGPDPSVVDQLARLGAVVVDPWRPWHLPEERAERLAAWVNHFDPAGYVLSVSPDVGWLALPFLKQQIVTTAVAQLDHGAFYGPLAHYQPFVDCAIGVSETICAQIREECGYPSNRVKHIPYGVDGLSLDAASSRWAAERSGPLRVGYVGRLDESQKRVREILILATELLRRGTDFLFDVVGDGPEKAHLVKETARAGLAGRVRFTGWLSRDAVRDRLSELDVLVLFSHVEGLPLALLEAMGHAVVPVVTRIESGHAEVVRDGENGYLVPVGDQQLFATRIQSIAADDSTLRRLRQEAWKTSRNYSVERMAQQYLAQIEGPSTARASRPQGAFPILPSCRSSHPRWLRRVKWRLAGGVSFAARR